jgi:hypothetical protein
MAFDPGDPGYSEMTPGYAWFSHCLKGHWEMRGYDVTMDEYRSNLLRANQCKDFEPVESLGKFK